MPEEPLPLYSLPTTAGTGSEITFSAVITDTDEKFKFTVKSPRIAPRVAYLDPEVTMSKPPQLTASTGLDALTHAIEAYTAVGAEVVSDAAALHAVELISTHLLTAVREGANEDARAGMLTGSLLAGIAFSHADVASVHCLAEALGGLYDLPHGVCNAIALPVVMEYNMDYALERYARLAEALGVSNTTETGSGAGTGAGAAVRQKAEAAVQAVRTLAVESGLPPFTSLGVEEKDFEHIAEMSERNGSNASNPRPMKKADYLELLRRLSEQ
jgi:alcohol dehydrogenase